MGRRYTGNGGGGSARARIINLTVPLASGLLTTVSRFGLAAPTSFAKTGGSANLSIATPSGAVSATSALTAGATQTLVGAATGADGVVIPFTLNLTGVVAAATQPAAPTMALTRASNQVTVAWTDGAAGGAAITSHRLYRATTAGFVPGAGNLVGTITTASPYLDTGLTNGTAYFYRLSAVNSVGEGATSAEASATPVAAAAGSYLASVAAAPYAVYGARRLVNGYNGSLFTLRRTSDNTTQAFGCAGGLDKPDYTAISAWAGSSDLYVTQIFDQTGQRAPLAQTDVTIQGRFDPGQTDYTGGVPFIIGDYFTNTQMTAAGFTLDRQNISHVMMYELLNASTTSVLTAIEGDSGTLVQSLFNNVRLAAFESSAIYAGFTTGWSRNNPTTIGLTSNAAERRFFFRGTSEAVAAGTAGAATTYRLGKNSTQAQGAQYKMWGVAIYPALTGADMATVIASADAACAFRTNAGFDRRVVVCGDSIALGLQYAKKLRNAQYFFLPALAGAPELVGRGIGGSTLATLDTNYANGTSSEGADRYFTTAYGVDRAMLVIQRGTNDLGAGTSASAIYASLTSIVGKAKATGYRVAACTVLPRNDGSWNSTKETERLAYNASVRANAAGAHTIIDFAANATIGDGTGAAAATVYFQDGLHPTDLGYQQVGPQYAAGINAAWP